MPRALCLFAARAFHATVCLAAHAALFGAVAYMVGCSGSATSRIDPAESTASEKTLTVTAPTRRVVEVEVVPPTPATQEAEPCE